MNFNSEEKVWISKIVETYQSDNWRDSQLDNLFKTLFDRELYLGKYFPYFTLKRGESGEKEQTKEYAKTVKEGYFSIARFVHLLEVLDKRHLILIIPFFENNINEGKEQTNEEQQEEQQPIFSFEETAVLDFLRNNLRSFILSTEDLKCLVENNFVSDEEIRFREQLTNDKKQFKKQYCLTCVSIAIAILIGLAGLFRNKSVEINPKQIQNFINKMDSVVNTSNSPEEIHIEYTFNETIKS
jgi:hypothetical protein